MTAQPGAATVAENMTGSLSHERLVSRLRSLAPLLILLAIAIFMRTYRMEISGWLPDTYDRLIDAERLAHGKLPISQVAPPGAAIILAPAFLIFPATFATMQAVVIAAGVGLVGVAYALVWRVARDGVAAVVFAGSIAIGPTFVFSARDGLYDTLAAFFVAITLVMLPLLRGKSLPIFVIYGVLLALLLNIRPTTVFVLPAILIYWHDPFTRGFRPRDFLTTLITKEAIVTFVTFLVLCLLSVLAGEWFGNATSVPITLDQYAENVLFYFGAVFLWPLAPLTVPIAAAGAWRLWRLNPCLTLAILVVLLLWPLSHAALPFARARYMLPGQFFVLLLAALAPQQILQFAAGARPRLGLTLRAYTALSIAALGLLFIFSSALILDRWPTIAANSMEGMARQMRPMIRDLEDDSLLVSAAARGVRASRPDLEYVDLIDQFVNQGNGEESVDSVIARVQTALARGGKVYYLYSHWDSGGDFTGGGRQGFEHYFARVEARYRVRELFRTHVDDVPWVAFPHPWILYSVEAR